MDAWKVRAWNDPAVGEAMVEGGFIAVGGEELAEDVSVIPPRRLQLLLERLFPDRTQRAIRTFVRYWQTFIHDIDAGDVVVVPLEPVEGARRAAIGVVRGEYEFVPDEEDPRRRHRRSVEWVDVVDRRDLDPDLVAVIGSPGTIGRIHAPHAADRLLAAARS